MKWCKKWRMKTKHHNLPYISLTLSVEKHNSIGPSADRAGVKDASFIGLVVDVDSLFGSVRWRVGHDKQEVACLWSHRATSFDEVFDPRSRRRGVASSNASIVANALWEGKIAWKGTRIFLPMTISAGDLLSGHWKHARWCRSSHLTNFLNCKCVKSTFHVFSLFFTVFFPHCIWLRMMGTTFLICFAVGVIKNGWATAKYTLLRRQ